MSGWWTNSQVSRNIGIEWFETAAASSCNSNQEKNKIGDPRIGLVGAYQRQRIFSLDNLAPYVNKKSLCRGDVKIYFFLGQLLRSLFLFLISLMPNVLRPIGDAERAVGTAPSQIGWSWWWHRTRAPLVAPWASWLLLSLRSGPPIVSGPWVKIVGSFYIVLHSFYVTV